MPKIPCTDPIKYLVYKKYPDLLPLAREENGLADAIKFEDQLIDTSPTLETHEWPRLSQEAEKYRQELMALDQNELDARYKSEVQKAHEEQDKKRFFHQHGSEADLDYWAKMPEWTIDEAVVLAFGKDPKVVTWARLDKILSYTSPFVQKCIQLKELILRARKANLLTEPRLAFSDDLITPYKFVLWAGANRINLPKELVDFVQQTYEANKPPKTTVEIALENLKKPPEKAEESLSQRTRRILDAKKMAQNELRATTPKKFHTKEKETLLKLIAGMAVDAYRYDPTASRSPLPKEISDALAQMGIPLDPDTVRKWLKEASEFIPQTRRKTGG